MRTQRKPAARFRVGDWVSFLYGPRRVWAQMIEDRGLLGVNRRRLYRVRLDQDSGESIAFEVPEDDLEAAVLEKGAVLRYLREGGLAAILRANLAGDRDHQRVWLTFTPRGDIVHTFTADRGLSGGAPAPSSAWHEGKVFTGKQGEVIKFLTSFGLTRTEAEDVLRALGTAP